MIKTLIKHVIVVAALCFSTMAFAEEPPVATAPVDSAPVEPAPIVPAPVAPAPAKPMSEMDKLKDQIQKLENKLTKMEEENDIRRRLETTDEEKTSGDEAILTAAGRDYTLMKPGSLGFEYSIRYVGDSYDSIQTASDKIVSSQHNTFHTVTNTFNIEFPVKENLTVSANIPFVYKMNSQTSENAKDVSDLGDTSFGFQMQPVKSGGDLPSFIVSGTLTCPTGRSPYKIDRDKEVSTGNGVYSVGIGCNMSKTIDPVVAFGGINVDHGLETKHLDYRYSSALDERSFISGVKPGDVYSFSLGIGYSLSYKTNLTMSYQYSYQSKTRYDGQGTVADFSSDASISSVFSVGTGWTLTPKNSVNVRLGIGLTNNDPDFSLLVRVPLTYEL